VAPLGAGATTNSGLLNGVDRVNVFMIAVTGDLAARWIGSSLLLRA
jgi:hypothetical protein